MNCCVNGNKGKEQEDIRRLLFSKVAPADYGKLKALLGTRLPQSVSMHNAVQLALTGKSEMEFYAYRGALEPDALIMGVYFVKNKADEEGFLGACMSTAEPTNLTEASAGAFVAYLQAETGAHARAWRPMMLEVARESSPVIVKALLDMGSNVTANPSQGFCYPLDKINLDPPAAADEGAEGAGVVVVKALEPRHAALVAGRWEYGILTAGGAEETTRSYIERNPSAAVYPATAHAGAGGEGEPLSWVACYDFGKVAMLYTPEEYRGRGYASLVMKRMVAEMARRGLVPTSAASARNLSSQRAMLKAGFVPSHQLDFIFAE